MTDPSLVLSVRNLTVTYSTMHGDITALNDVSFDIGEGTALALVGESGSGKSTAALAILDILPAEATVRGGSILYKGRDLMKLDAHERRALRGNDISIVFQDPFTSLNPSLTVGRQVAETLEQHKGLDRKAAQERAIALLSDVRLPQPMNIAQSYPHQLSGGMQQRVLIAIALACEPELIILDEPTTALDVTIEAQILDLLQELRETRHLNVLFITHNLGVVNRFCDEVCVLYAGHVLERGPTRDILARPLHPYPKGLLGSLPRLSAPKDRLTPIPGKFPDLALLPTGCVFHPRCPFVEERCRSDAQVLTAENIGHTVRCWKADALRDASWSEAISAPARPQNHRRVASSQLVEVRNLHKRYQLGGLLSGLEFGWSLRAGPRLRFNPIRVKAVDGVSLTIAPGETLGLVGESGCGKTTLGHCILRLVVASSGQVLLDGRDITHARESSLKWARKTAQIVFQNADSSLNPRKTIYQIISRPLVLFERCPSKERRGRVDELLAMVGLSPAYALRYPHQLSGGEKQRACIARALAGSPKFVVCDEAVAGLDVSLQATILNLLADLRDRLGLAYLFISHDLSTVAHFSDRVAVMYAGVLCEEGPTMDVMQPPYHPYTEALLSAIPFPDPDSVDRPRIRLRGETEVVIGPVQGCRFHHRCPRKIGAICEHETPPVVETRPGHRIACHIPLDELRSLPLVVQLDDRKRDVQRRSCV